LKHGRSELSAKPDGVDSLPKVGDVIYVDSELHVWHGADDFRGGKATVLEVDAQGGWIQIKERPGDQYNWTFLSQQQSKLAAKFGDTWAHSDPDFRPEFNDDSEGWNS
jgi:hypothetical protein